MQSDCGCCRTHNTYNSHSMRAARNWMGELGGLCVVVVVVCHLVSGAPRLDLGSRPSSHGRTQFHQQQQYSNIGYVGACIRPGPTATTGLVNTHPRPPVRRCVYTYNIAIFGHVCTPTQTHTRPPRDESDDFGSSIW